MSAHCCIAYKDDLKYGVWCYVSISCDSKGHPGGVGAVLLDYYTDEDEIKNLIDGGDLVELGTTLDLCTYYDRDRGETGTDPDMVTDLYDLLASISFDHIEHLYVFEGGEWLYYPGPVFIAKNRRPLAEVVTETAP